MATKYRVSFRVVWSGSVLIEADTKEEADKQFSAMSSDSVLEHAEDMSIEVIGVTDSDS